MGSVYILGKDITDKSIYIFSDINVNDTVTLRNIAWRYGIFRANAVIAGAYILGLFNLLIFTVYLFTAGKVHLKYFIPLISGIIASASRMAYGGLLFMGLSELVRRRKWPVLLLLIIIVVALTQLNIIDGPSISGMLDSYIPQSAEEIDPGNIREVTRYKAIEIWKDHPLLGVGPGMFGGTIALKYHSYIHNEYNLQTHGHLESVGNIEQFWFQLLTETGLIGALCFINFIIFLFITLYKAREQVMSQEIKNLFSALIVFIGCIMIYCLGSGLNIAPVLFTYCAFVGIGLGSFNEGIKG